MVIPARSESSFVFDQHELTCRNPQMQRLYESILAHVGGKILQHRIIDGNDLFFELATHSGRTQLVVACSHYDALLERERLAIHSRIGTISEDASAVLILGAATRFPFISFSLDDNLVVTASMLTDLDGAVDELWKVILYVASAADILEDALFEWDAL